MGFLQWTWVLRAVCVALFSRLAQAKLPFSSNNIKEGLQQGPNGVTFDPLAVAAILHNPRANTSAAKLYMQRDRDLFRWPHTMMFGGTLIPLKLLVQHLTSRPSSLHPAISMCWDTAIKIPVRSTRAFPKELSVNTGNEWLKGVLGFDSSSSDEESSSDNDLLVAHVWDAFGEPMPQPASSFFNSFAMALIGWLTGFVISVALVFSVLVADIWAAVLFLTYLCHWAASVAVAYYPLVNIYQPSIRSRTPISRTQTDNFARPPPSKSTVPENSEALFCIHERDEGGSVVFKGRRDTIEAWARIGWSFNKKHSMVHWTWIITGTLAAVASVACMVNMYGALQLGFLAMLIYSSLGEILATRIAGNLQHLHKRHARIFPVVHNTTRTQAIIRASLEVEAASSLAGLNWIDLTLLPRMMVFVNMQNLLKEMSEMPSGMGEDDITSEKILTKLLEGVEKESNPDEQQGLAERLMNEIWDAWSEREAIQGTDV